MGTPAQPSRTAPPRARRDWVKVEITALAILAIAICVALGVRARKRSTAVHGEVDRLRSVASGIQQFQASFQPVTATERGRWAALPDSGAGALAIAPENRLALTETIARLAESSGLEHPRVSFGAADSVVVARDIAGLDAAPGDYTISIDAGGGFSELLTFVNALPVAVSVARLDGIRDSSRARFHVTLAVYETKSAKHS